MRERVREIDRRYLTRGNRQHLQPATDGPAPAGVSRRADGRID
jgi:hypothetical protein